MIWVTSQANVRRFLNPVLLYGYRKAALVAAPTMPELGISGF